MQIAEVELLGVPRPHSRSSWVLSGPVVPLTAAPASVFTDGATRPLLTQAGGLKDGNYPYSDRTYPWNQTPKEFVGAEYIRTINSDKNVAG